MSARSYHTSTPHSSEYAKVKTARYDWYTLACSKNIFPCGPQLIENARQTAEGKPNFAGSRGWLDKWKKRYNIKMVKVSDKSGDVSGQTVDSWKERLPEIVRS
uniref:HTH CENPB-type domain-containing protein n=1 Tax=Amphimedon queenslandica TaxID=400682 RepID=A0A1X7UKV3_AMPQE